MSNTENADNATFEIDGLQLTLADLAGADVADVELVRGGFEFPKGLYKWKVSEDPENHPGLRPSQDNTAVSAVFPLVCVEVLSINDKDFTGSPDECLNKVQYERRKIASREGIGRTRALVADMGGVLTGPFGTQIESTMGKMFIAPITHRKDPNDSDRTFVNIDTRKLKQVAA